MNQDQVKGLVRICVGAGCAWLAARGYDIFGDEAFQAQIVAVVIGIATLVWTFLAHSNANKLKAAAAVDPEIEIEVPDHIVANDKHIKKVVEDKTVTNVNQLVTKR